MCWVGTDVMVGVYVGDKGGAGSRRHWVGEDDGHMDDDGDKVGT